MNIFSLSTLLLAVSLGSASLAQVRLPENNPFVNRARQLGNNGLSGEILAGSSPIKFKDGTTSNYFQKYLEAITEKSPSDAELIKKDFGGRFNWLNSVAKKYGSENDGAFAFAYSLLYLNKRMTGTHVQEKDIHEVWLQIKKFFQNVKGSDKQKHEFYEWSLCTAFTFRMLVGPPDQIVEVQKEFAGDLFTVLTGAKPEAITFSDGKLLIKAAKRL